jgi:hypothetical protein
MHWMWRMLVVAACLGVVLAFGELRAPSAETGPATIRVTARQAQSTSIDVGRRGRSPGDTEVTASLVYNTRITPRSIGSYELVCEWIRTVSRSCRGSIVLPRGTVVVAGTMRHRPLYQLAVIGGTGLYDNARGTLTVTRLGTRPVRDLLVVRLLG